MGYFIVTSPIAVAGTGNTVSSEGTLTADCISLDTSELSFAPATMIFGGECESIATVEISLLDITGYSVREAFSIATSEATELDIGIATEGLLYYDRSYE